MLKLYIKLFSSFIFGSEWFLEGRGGGFSAAVKVYLNAGIKNLQFYQSIKVKPGSINGLTGDQVKSISVVQWIFLDD